MTRRNQSGRALVVGLAFPRYTIGHFLNQPDNPTAFAMLRFETMDEPQVDDVHRHLFYELIWVDAGQSQQAIDYQRYPVGAGSLFFISPGQVHEFEEWEPLRGGSILFTADFFLLNHPDQDKLFELSFLDNFYANPLLHPADTDFRAIRQTIALLDTEYQRPDRADAVLQPLLHSLLAQIQRCVDQQPGAGRVSRQYVVQYKQFRQLIDQHFATARSVSNYADQLNLTPHHLNLICRQVTGQTAGGVIRTRVALEAKRLLTFTDLPVSDIAAQLGYVDPSYFARLFRQQTGLTPQAFRLSVSATGMSEKYRQ